MPENALTDGFVILISGVHEVYTAAKPALVFLLESYLDPLLIPKYHLHEYYYRNYQIQQHGIFLKTYGYIPNLSPFTGIPTSVALISIIIVPNYIT